MISDSQHPASAPAVTAEGETFDSAPRRLQFVEMPVPQAGRCVEIAPGVRWARIPLPIDLNHINVWLVDTHDGCIVVDTGLAAPVGVDAWEAIAAGGAFTAKPLRAVFVTHIHPDHIGLAGWLQERYGVPVLMSRRTHEMATLMLDAKATAQFGDQSAAFFSSHGLSDTSEIQTTFRPERFARMTTGLPNVERFVADSETLRWSGEWTALETNGHAEGHLCLSNTAARVLISGDQVLPTISSNISLTFRGNDPNPLESYLSSLRRLRALAADTLVLPAHGVPFRGLQHRIDDLSQHHEEQLEKLLRACVEPKSTFDVLPLMFRRELKGMHLVLAMGEALAHLEYLVQAGRMERKMSAGGLIRYVSK